MSHKTCWWLVGPVLCMEMKGEPTNKPYSSLVGGRGWHCAWLEGPASCIATKGEPTNKSYNSLVGCGGWQQQNQ